MGSSGLPKPKPQEALCVPGISRLESPVVFEIYMKRGSRIIRAQKIGVYMKRGTPIVRTQKGLRVYGVYRAFRVYRSLRVRRV